MKILYTGAISPDTPQNQSIKSLGGFLSNSPIPNGEVGSLFSSVSGIIKPGFRSIRMIGIRNDELASKTNLKIWATISSPELSITLAAMAPALDSVCNKFFFERIDNPHSLPLQATFNNYTETNPIIISNLDPQKFIGLWIKLEKPLVPTTTTTTTQLIQPGYCSCQESEIQLLRQRESNPIEHFNINISISFD